MTLHSLKRCPLFRTKNLYTRCSTSRLRNRPNSVITAQRTFSHIPTYSTTRQCSNSLRLRTTQMAALSRPDPRRTRQFSSTARRQIIFSFTNPAEERHLRSPVYGPGMDVMVDLNRKLKLQSKTPSPAEIRKAINTFFTHVKKQGIAIEDVRVGYVLPAVLTLLEHNPHTQQPDEPLSAQEVSLILDGLAKRPRGPTIAHRELALELTQYLDDRASEPGPLARSLSPGMALALVKTLCFSSDYASALEVLQTRFTTDMPETSKGWLALAGSLAEAGQTDAFVSVLEEAGRAACHFTTRQYCSLAQKAVSDEILTIICKEGSDRANSLGAQEELLASVLETGVKIIGGPGSNKDNHAAERVFDAVRIEKIKTKRLAAETLAWESATRGSLERIERMISDIRETDPSLVDIATVNRILEASIIGSEWEKVGMHIPKLAESLGLKPDSHTLAILSHQTFQSTGSLENARRLLDRAIELEEEERDIDKHVNSASSELISKTLNEMITRETESAIDRDSLPGQREAAADNVLNLVEDLDMRGKLDVPFETKTIKKLATFHFHRNEIYDLIDLLRTNMFLLNTDERKMIMDSLISLTTSADTTTGGAWDLYTVIEETFGSEGGFGEFTIPVGIKLMEGFFSRGRADMACLVFERITKVAGHQIAHSILISPEVAESSKRQAVTKALRDAYTVVFTGIAQAADPAALDFAFSQLKIDELVDPTTRLLNSVMLAHAACSVDPAETAPPPIERDSQPLLETEDDTYAPAEDTGSGTGPGRAVAAVTIFDRIERLPEGASHSTVLIALWACEQLSIAAGAKTNDMPAHIALAVSTTARIWERATKLIMEEGLDARWAGGGGGSGLGRSWPEQLMAGVVGALAASNEVGVAKELLVRQSRPWEGQEDLAPPTEANVWTGAPCRFEPIPGLKVTADVLAVMFNSVPTAGEQRELLGWMADEFPAVLKELRGRQAAKAQADGRAFFEIDRVLVP